MLDTEAHRAALVGPRPVVCPETALASDSDVLRRFQQGDAQAFAMLLREYRAQVYGYLCRCGVPVGTRDDLFQEIFLKVNHAAARFDCQRAFRPWLFAIAVNAVRSHFRKPRLIEVSSTPEEQVAEEPTGDEVVAARETAFWLEEAIKTLPIAQREVLILICVQNMDRQEAATTLGTNIDTVKTQLRRARLALAKKLASRNARTEHESQKRVSQ